MKIKIILVTCIVLTLISCPHLPTCDRSRTTTPTVRQDTGLQGTARDPPAHHPNSHQLCHRHEEVHCRICKHAVYTYTCMARSRGGGVEGRRGRGAAGSRGGTPRYTHGHTPVPSDLVTEPRCAVQIVLILTMQNHSQFQLCLNHKNNGRFYFICLVKGKGAPAAF